MFNKPEKAAFKNLPSIEKVLNQPEQERKVCMHFYDPQLEFYVVGQKKGKGDWFDLYGYGLRFSAHKYWGGTSDKSMDAFAHLTSGAEIVRNTNWKPLFVREIPELTKAKQYDVKTLKEMSKGSFDRNLWLNPVFDN